MVEIFKMIDFWYATLIAFLIIFILFYIKNRLKKLIIKSDTIKRKNKAENIG